MATIRFEWERALDNDPDVTGNLHHLLTTMAHYISTQGTIRIGVAKLAASTGLHEATVKRKLARAREAGFLVMVSRGHRRGDGYRAVSVYRPAHPSQPLNGERLSDGEPVSTAQGALLTPVSTAQDALLRGFAGDSLQRSDPVSTAQSISLNSAHGYPFHSPNGVVQSSYDASCGRFAPGDEPHADAPDPEPSDVEPSEDEDETPEETFRRLDEAETKRLAEWWRQHPDRQ